ncbi:MAG: putative Protein kinase [Planctomycetota bacterium]|nr:putative Protein kinase [Planctomycetota bacterium]
MATTSCPEDAMLAEAAVEGRGTGPMSDHLRECPGCRKRFGELRALLTGLDLLASATVTVDSPTLLDCSRTLGRPTSIGKYFVVGVLQGREGMTAYRGVHSLIKSDEVAIFLADTAWVIDEESKARFRSACASLTRLEHPAIAGAVDLGSLDGRPYLIIEYVNGDSFERVVGGRTFSASEAAAIGAELARALATAHASGVVHGSLRPDSLRFDESGRVRISDFGVSRLAETSPEAATPSADLAALVAIVRGLAPELPDPAGRFRDAEGLARAFDREARPGWPGLAASARAVLRRWKSEPR